ncbi:histidine phosphatase family protein [Candidatus Protochlamydia sp. W-9]|uniref:histidine phosphatase family protein n=1 Tax=Candidatus Protochlamydia sp. W-9 TaxID=1785087 RepID=UPI00096A6C3E|nr:histidine phosphatase family protein [Candidatus Protochlamydia sp. W-9]
MIDKNLFCDIYLIRHGETDWNMLGKLQGHIDISLNSSGKIQARNLQKQLNHINFAAAFSSDLSRARQTAEIVLESKDIKIEETAVLRERQLGEWEGQSIDDLKNWLQKNSQIDSFIQEDFLAYKWDSISENYAEVFNRLSTLVLKISPLYLGSTILLSSHGGLLRSVLYQLDFKSELRWHVDNCGFIKIRANNRGEMIIAEYHGIKTSRASSSTF